MKSAKFRDIDGFGSIERTLLGAPLLWISVSIVLFAIQGIFPTGDEPSLLSLRYETVLSVNMITTPLLCITLSLASLSAFKKYVNFPSAFMQYISRASYTIYVIHMPICIWVSYLLIPYNLPLAIKLSLSVLSGVLASLGVYEFLKLSYGGLSVS